MEGYTLDSSTGEWYNEQENKYLSHSEYIALKKSMMYVSCRRCNHLLFEDEICWCGGN